MRIKGTLLKRKYDDTNRTAEEMQQKLGSQNQQQPASDGTLKTEIPDLNGPVTPVPAANASFVPPVHSAAAPVVQAQVVQQPAAPAQPVQPQMVQLLQLE